MEKQQQEKAPARMQLGAPDPAAYFRDNWKRLAFYYAADLGILWGTVRLVGGRLKLKQLFLGAGLLMLTDVAKVLGGMMIQWQK